MIIATIILGVLALVAGIVWIVELIRSDYWISNLGWTGSICFFLFGFIWLVCLLSSIKVEFSEQNVSGVVYNAKNNSWPLGNTKFSIRASENTYVSEENRSRFCLPPNSPYIELVNKAAQDKSVKVVVTTEKMFEFVTNPWTCVDNVKVELQSAGNMGVE